MARYRKVDSRIWNDAKFRRLSDPAKLAFLFVLTHPHMTSLGAMRATIPGLAEEIGWEAEDFREVLGEAFLKGMAKHDSRAAFLWLPNFLKYNRPESPNVVKAWGDALDLLPECALKASLIQHVKAFVEGLTEGFAKALPEAFAKTMPYPDPEQEQEPDLREDPLFPLTRGNGNGNGHSPSGRRARPIRDQSRRAWLALTDRLEAVKSGSGLTWEHAASGTKEADPLAHEVVLEIGGYSRVGRSELAPRKELMQRFRERYEQQLSQQPSATPEACPP